MIEIRQATIADIPSQLRIAEAAKQIMRASGNLHQWGPGYPSADVFQLDIERGGSYIVECDGEPVATFAFLPQPEPTYETIVGEWETTSEPYHVIHRIAKCGQQQGIMRVIMEFCMERSRHLRVDTHRENHIMQHLLLKFGFRYRGIIYLQNGDERLAYQLILPPRTS